MLQRKIGAMADSSTIADCDPVVQQRDFLARGLNVKGMISAPVKIDLSKIIPVTEVNRYPHRYLTDLYVFDLSGLTNASTVFFDAKRYNVEYAELVNLAFVFSVNAVGRAAMVGAGTAYGTMMYLNRTYGVVDHPVLCNWLPFNASAGNPAYIHWNSGWTGRTGALNNIHMECAFGSGMPSPIMCPRDHSLSFAMANDLGVWAAGTQLTFYYTVRY